MRLFQQIFFTYKIEYIFILILLTNVFSTMVQLAWYKTHYLGHILCTLLLLSVFWQLPASHLYLKILLPPTHRHTINSFFLFFLCTTKALFHKVQMLWAFCNNLSIYSPSPDSTNRWAIFIYITVHYEGNQLTRKQLK